MAGSSPEFDSIAALAAGSLGVPVAFISFIEAEGEVVKASRGWNVTVIPPACSFAPRISGVRDVVVIPDTQSDPRLASHPLVTGAPHIRFFAAAPILDGSGGFSGAVCVVDRVPRTLTTDQITILRLLGERVTAGQEVANRMLELNDRFREFFEQTDDLVMSIAADGRLLHANEAVPSALGRSREEVMREPITTFIAPEEREPFREALAEVFQGETRHVETVLVSSGGQRITVEGSLRPKHVAGSVMLARVLFRDISDRKEFETELGNARDAALEAARLKTQFLTNVSHEIRTPMNGIIGMLDLLLDTEMNEEQRDYAYQARASADQLLSIVNNILYVSNVEAGGLASDNVDFDLYRTTQRIVEVMKVAALGKDVEVLLEFDPALPPIMRGNQGKIRQVLTNLLENAVKFTDRGTVKVNVARQKETETHNIVRFDVSDTGIGVSAEDRLLLFEKFSQVDGGQTRKYQGVGLGLATARQLVETMGGLIDVDSIPGKGSTFWFSVPFPKSATASRKPIASSDLEFKGKRVLLVDGSATSRKIVRYYLEGTWQMKVDVAENAMTAIAALRQAQAYGEPYRVIVFDAMPDLDPFSFAREVRADQAIRSTSLIHVVATQSLIDREAMRDAGMNSFVVKPVGQSELFDAMTVALAQDAIPLPRAVVSRSVQETPVAPSPVRVRRREDVRVLLAEDNFLNMKLTMSQLQKLGFRADSVANGQEAVEAVAKNDYAVILMDCQMPVLDGYQATMEIRRREKELGHPPRRIIAMTANALAGDREKCLAAGMDDYLAKPTRHDELESALTRALAESAT